LTPREARIRERCLTYYRSLDELIAGIVELAGPDATVVLASDHGFGAQEGTFFVNTWLEQQGLLGWADREKSEGSTPQELGIGQLARHVYQLDWKQTRAYAPTPSGNAIYIVRQSAENPHGVPEAEIPALRAALVEQLGQVIDPVSGEAVVSRVWLREEVFSGPFEELAPDLTLQLRDGGQVSIVASDTVYRERPEPSGTHRRTGIFMAAGPGIAAGTALPDLSILDVAPLLLYSLNLPVPQELEGAVPLAAYRPAYVVEHPVQIAAAQPLKRDKPQKTAPRPMRDAAMDAELMKRLRALGYVE
jgi:predicted AlkP superfamily phosphohydrolase/phosphomutase